ncbi:MAG: type II secretion system protein [Sulfurimonas sp.]|nr:type II secretion system protein [Sulfurimonas sp.]
MVKRTAFTYIELIFSIVIIAITVVSLPMMSRVISDGISSSIVQEAIFAAATELNEVTTAHWDDNSLEPGASNSFAKVIDFGLCNNNRLMPGHIEQTLHRKCLDSNITNPSDASPITTVQSLNDYVHASSNIFINAITDETGYKEEYNSALTVTRPANFDGNNTNIKKITITIIKKMIILLSSLH